MAVLDRDGCLFRCVGRVVERAEISLDDSSRGEPIEIVNAVTHADQNESDGASHSDAPAHCWRCPQHQSLNYAHDHLALRQGEHYNAEGAILNPTDGP